MPPMLFLTIIGFLINALVGGPLAIGTGGYALKLDRGAVEIVETLN
jgi:hypothetical protein